MADKSPLSDLAEVAKIMQNQPKSSDSIARTAGFPMTPPGSNPVKMVGGVRDVPKNAVKPLPTPADDMPDPKTMMAKKPD